MYEETEWYAADADSMNVVFAVVESCTEVSWDPMLSVKWSPIERDFVDMFFRT